MRALLEDEEEETRRADTEITLGMKSLLGVFFGAVLVCGVFFGLGYSMGRGGKGATAPGSATPASTPAASQTTAKPTVVAEDEAGANASAAAQPEQGPDSSTDNQQESSSTKRAPAPQSGTSYDYVPTPNGPARQPAGAARSASLTAVETPARVAKPSAGVPQAAPAVATVAPGVPSAHAEQAALTTTPTSGAGSIMVQIAAVSRTEDASILVGALKKHGYSATMRTDTRDNLVHVQVGPFASREEAKAMRSRLMADGYNAILK